VAAAAFAGVGLGGTMLYKPSDRRTAIGSMMFGLAAVAVLAAPESDVGTGEGRDDL
jgi:hypothetical protein